jgi:toxin ParE1/3/4
LRKFRLLERARLDVRIIHTHTEERFGAGVRARYERLINAAFRDLCENPARPGVKSRAGLPAHVRLYHIRYSRERVAKRGRVARPRHLIVFRADDEWIEILRVLHDSMDLERHLPADDDS